MSQLTDLQIAKVAAVAGFTKGSLVIAVAVCLAESGGDTNAKGYNRDARGNIISIDRGLWQINNVYHSEVSDTCAYNDTCNAQAAYRISSKGTNWNPWSTYTQGTYRQFISRATTAANAVGSAGQGVTPPLPPSPSTPPAPPPGTIGGTPTAAPLVYNPVTLSDFTNANLIEEGKGDSNTAYKIILALLIMFGFIYVVSKTRAGYAAIYYTECLILLFLFATQSTFFKESLLPLASLSQPQGDATSNNNTLNQPAPPVTTPPVVTPL